MPVLGNSENEIKRYNEFVRNSPYARVSQDMNWEHVKKGWGAHYVYLEERGEIVAALSILYVNAVNDKKLFYANRGPVCDFYDVDLVERLLKEAEPVINKDKPFLLRLDPEVKYDERLLSEYKKRGYIFRSRETDSHAFVQPRFNMVLRLSGKTEETLLSEFHPKTKYNIGLADRKGVKTHFVNADEPEFLDAMDKFFNLTKIMAERQGITHRPKDYFLRLFEAVPKSRIYLSTHEDEVLSAALSIPYNKKLFYMYGASSNNKRNLMPNYHMQWEMIKWALELGMYEYDFGGVFKLDESDGLYRFKNGFCKTEGYTEYIGELDLVFDHEAYEEYTSR